MEITMTQFQFPMGMAKERDRNSSLGHLIVSIPYGNGKSGIIVTAKFSGKNVSIPYGNGKSIRRLT